MTRRARTARAALPLLAALLTLTSAAIASGAIGASPAGAAAIPSPPRISGDSAAVLEASTSIPVLAIDAGQERLIASTTKMMTALVTVASVPLTKVCTAPYYPAGADESLLGLRTGERMTVADLLRGLLVVSGNDAAADLAVCVSGSIPRFVAAMNAKARALGLHHSHFTTPVGLDTPGNAATAADLARIGIDVRGNAFLRGVVDLRHVTLSSGDFPRNLTNRNTLLLDVPWVNGVKTGHTNAAGYILVASGAQHGLTFVASVLGEPSECARDADALALLRWAFASYHFVRPFLRGTVYARPRLRDPAPGDAGARVDLVAATTVRKLLKRDAAVRLRVDAPASVAGPLRRHAVVGHVTVVANGRTLARVPLITARAVPAAAAPARAPAVVARAGSLVPIVAIPGSGGLLPLPRLHGEPRRPRRRADLEAA